MLNAYCFYLEVTLSPAALDQFIDAYAFTPARLSAALGGGEVEVTNVALTIFTAMFLHGGWLHLLDNMLFLWIFGDNVEDALGHFTYLISYLIFGVAATLTHFLIDPFSSIPALGASGAIAGVLGFYLILYPGARVLFLIPILVFFWLVRVPAAIFLFVWFIFQTFGGVATVGQQVGGGVHEELLLPVLGPARLRMELDRTLWRDQDHLGIKQLWAHLCSYLYLPRLRDQDVLLRAIQEGISTVVASESFAYAEGYDEDTGCYLGLRMGGGGSVVMDSSSLLVKPEAALVQAPECLQGHSPPTPPPPPPPPPNGKGGPHPQKLPVRFYGSITLDPERVGRDAGRVADEILSHLSSLPGANVKVTMEIEAETTAGVPEHVQRTVSENAGVLKFELHGFERE